ncbi:MAG TPA: hypothetical protein VG992_02085 [Candidatus Saccharimonadales bacterium]|nr:hypothetical protein [Candidatus Saccharimonadales bacterium]
MKHLPRQIFKAVAVTIVAMASALSVAAPKADAYAYFPENLMSDAIFTDSSTMSTSAIQSFLESKNSGLATRKATESCGSKSGTHYSFYNTYYDCSKSVTDAQIIHDAGKAYGINPRVILATLQKEQSLVTDPSPSSSQINCAMGYNSCSGFSGFFSQVDNGAWQFRVYIELMNGRSYWGYDPSSYPCRNAAANFYSAGLYPGNKVKFYDVGGTAKTITIANSATAALYCYTPYVGPYSETGYSGSYNFVISYDTWWGPSTNIPYTSLSTPRWMQTKAGVFKKNLATEANTGSAYAAGTQIYFSTKVVIDGHTYLRTQSDTANKLDKGILLSDLQEIPVSWTPLTQPQYYGASTNLYKVDPITGEKIGSLVTKGQDIFFKDSFTVGGVQYLRSESDSGNNLSRGIPWNSLSDLTYDAMQTPRYMATTVSLQKVNPATRQTDTQVIPAGQDIFFTKSMVINGVQYLQSQDDDTNHLAWAIPRTSLDELVYTHMQTARYMRTNTALSKIDPKTGQNIGAPIAAGQDIYFTDSITVNGVQYLRTQFDSAQGWSRAIPRTSLDEITYAPMQSPRYMVAKVSLHKINPLTGHSVGSVITKGEKLYFTDSITVNGVQYLRTQFDSAQGWSRAIPRSQLSEIH